MRFEEADQLLEPGYLPLESGYRFFDDGHATVASIARMPGCSSEMVAWWFGWLQGTEHYKLWHPRDHVFCDWENREPGQYIGASHRVHEYMGGSGPLYKLRITFLDPSAIFDPAAYARLDGVAICARSGLLEEPLDTGYLIHCVRNTDYGCEMRSRFFMGHMASREAGKTFTNDEATTMRKGAVTEQRVTGLHKHATEEMGYLAELLPILYRQANGSLVERKGVLKKGE